MSNSSIQLPLRTREGETRIGPEVRNRRTIKGVLIAMARFSSLFGSSASKGEASAESLELELRRRLDERIEQALADAIIGMPAPEKEVEAPAPEPIYWLDTIGSPTASAA